MADLTQFRTLVTHYRKPWTQGELAAAIGLSAIELSHRLGGTGRQALTKENVLHIVLTLAKWQALSWEQAVELLVLMDYPLDTFQWKTRLQEHLSPPALALSPTQKGTPSAFVPDAPEGSQQLTSGRRRLFQARDLPKGYIPRPKAFDAIKHLLLNRQDGQMTAITTALRGAGGFGKTTLALALCHDPEIQAAFPDGILWVELGEQPPRALDLLNGLLASLEGSHSGAITLVEARERWRAALYDRESLLVIDDVWQAEALSPLLEGGLRCLRLVTTRNDLLLPEEATRIWVDAMEPEEAIAVLCRGLPEEIEQAAYQPRLRALVTRLGCWPLLVTLARGMLVTWLREGKTVVQALAVVEQAYERRGIVAFHLASASERQQTADACLNVSLRHLEGFTPTHYHATARYQELAVFPEDIDIPLTTLHTYWQGTGGLEGWETEDLCSRLHDLSLLLTCDLGKGTIRLHDVLRRYLVQRAGPHLPALHGQFLDVSQRLLGLKRWADLPAKEHYLWHHLILHLCQTGHREALQDTLIDLNYLSRKALYVGISALEADLLLARESEQTDPDESAPSLFAFLHRTIRQISHLLRQVHTPAEMGGLLLSQLVSYPAFMAQQQVLERRLPRPFLTAWHPLPERSSAALLRTLHGHTGSVTGCAVSLDGRFIVSASDDSTLKVWDAATGADLHTLRGHTSTVEDCAVSPDGRFIVSASWDDTLKVWDAATGIESLSLTGHTDSVNDCAVSPDGRFIVSASDDSTLKVWDAATGADLHTLTGHTGLVYGCAVSPDGRFIVSASDDTTLKVWDAATGAERLSLSGHISAVIGCAVGPDGRFIVSCSYDGTLKLWDGRTGRCVLTFPVDGELSGCTFHPDGEHLVACGAQGVYFLRLVM
jgi:WD40 repeat protein